MATLRIVRPHGLDFALAHEIASDWARQAEAQFGLQCERSLDGALARIAFARTGVNGTLTVNDTLFELEARLGFLLGAYQARIEAEILRQLDQRLGPPPA